MPASTESCQYQTGKTLGNGTYAIVKEAIHIQTGKRYACKVINKRLMHGREFATRSTSSSAFRAATPNIVTLHDYFETPHNVYLCFDLCTGGELFDRICGKGNYYEKYGLPYCEPYVPVPRRSGVPAFRRSIPSRVLHCPLTLTRTSSDAADLVRTILTAPENLLFRTPAEDADIMIADFGLSRFMDGEKLSQLTEVCGTHGYMAPEIYLQSVVTYALLVGYTPFDRNTPQAEMEAVIAGDYCFEPEESWADVSGTARDFITACLTIDPEKRPTVQQALEHKWLASATPHFVPSPTGGPTDLLLHVKKVFDAQHPWKKTAFSSTALHQINPNTAHPLGKEAQKLSDDLRKYKEESEQEILEEAAIVHHHSSEE
ncbi:Protein kinase domain-containing protein [Mycena kentingensis (nom. inval.)]|nr:Protein kinase domain-containing protein [Mycena kentingensis (nom. inval.)]